MNSFCTTQFILNYRVHAVFSMKLKLRPKASLENHITDLSFGCVWLRAQEPSSSTLFFIQKNTQIICFVIRCVLCVKYVKVRQINLQNNHINLLASSKPPQTVDNYKLQKIKTENFTKISVKTLFMSSLTLLIERIGNCLHLQYIYQALPWTTAEQHRPRQAI